jgi:catechol 2,3-dioxygenase-like lactoylglutathione lyase family enzyme
MTTRFHHTAIACSDLQESINFYREVFDLEIVLDCEVDPIEGFGNSRTIHAVHMVHPADKENGARLALVEWLGAKEQDVPRGYIVLSFECDIPETKSRMEKLGYDTSHLDFQGELGGYAWGPDNIRLHVSSKQFGMRYGESGPLRAGVIRFQG